MQTKFIPKRMQFHTTNRCQLNCHFCAKGDIKKTREVMDLNTFIIYAGQCVDYGIRNYELTPIVGDPMLDPYLLNRIDYLNWLKGKWVDKVIIYTNLVKYGNIEEIISYPVTEVNISIYGSNTNEYFSTTGCDYYDIFKNNLRRLLTFVREKGYEHKVVLWGRNFSLHKTYDPYIFLNDISKYDASGDTDWKKMLKYDPFTEHNPQRKGICKFTLEDNCIFPNGDITVCGWFDINKKSIIGNLKKQTLDEIYDPRGKFFQILSDQLEYNYYGICKNCTIWKKNFKSHVENIKDVWK